jgi:hypothetical protein
MTGYRVAVACLTLAAVTAGCVLGRQPVSPWGRAVRVAPVPAAALRVSGELLAVSAESLWVALRHENVSVPFDQVERVYVRRSNLGAGQALGYSVMMGLVTGGALAAACGQVDDAACGAVLPVAVLSWLAWGALSGMSLEAGAFTGVPAAEWEQLRPYARFPQGLPESVPRRAVAGARP